MPVNLYISYFLLFVILCFIVFQDFKFKAVSWILFPLLAIISFIISIQQLPVRTVLLNSLLNVAFFSTQLVLISIYFSIKKWKISWILNRYLGLGDVLFLFAIIFLFHPVNYILFLVSGFAFSLFLSVIYFVLYKPQEKHIPLAGIMSIILAILVILRIFLTLDLMLDDTLLFGIFFKP